MFNLSLNSIRYRSLHRVGVWGVVVVLAALVLSLMCAPPQAHAHAKNTYRGTNGIGITTPGFHGDSNYADIDQAFRAASELGVDWTRILVPWYFIENTRGRYDWRYLDQTVAMAEKYNLKVMMQVSTAPQWATSVNDLNSVQKSFLGHYPDSYAPKPQFYGDYAKFFAAVVKRYAPRGVVDYEVWNEPSVPRFWKESNSQQISSPESYTRLLKATYPAAHAAYPRVNVIAGGQVVTRTSGGEVNAVDFLKRMYAAGAKGYFDSLSHHPYGIQERDWIWNGWAYINNRPSTYNPSVETLHSLMVANGDGHKEIWLTEAGKDTQKGLGEESQQARIYKMYLDEWNSTPNLGPIIFYELQDQAGYGQWDRELYFGVLRRDGSRKPAAEVISDYTRSRGTATGAGATFPAFNPEELNAEVNPPKTDGDKPTRPTQTSDGAAYAPEGESPEDNGGSSGGSSGGPFGWIKGLFDLLFGWIKGLFA